jgi:hypothetical protein
MGRVAGRGVTPTSSLFSTTRAPQQYNTIENRAWRRHLEREHLAAANLLCNRLGSQASGLSFLQSSSGAGGGWEVTATRTNASSLMLQRLDSAGQLAGPLQLTWSSDSLLRATPPADELPDDFASPRSRTSRSPSADLMESSARLGDHSSAALDSLYGRRPGTSPEGFRRGTRGMGFPALGADLREDVLHRLELRDNVLGRRRYRPPPVISQAGGLPSRQVGGVSSFRRST